MCVMAAQRSTANNSGGPFVCASDGVRDGGEACVARIAQLKVEGPYIGLVRIAAALMSIFRKRGPCTSDIATAEFNSTCEPRVVN
jgi:hypothetical protein